MGRRTDFEDEFRPIEEKLVEIVASSDYRGLRFGDIVRFAEKAGISRPSVARHLNALVRRGVLKKDGVYRLAMEAINWKHAQRSLFSVLAMHLFDELYEKTGQGKVSDEEFTRLFTTRIGALAMYTMLVGLSKAEKHPEEGGKWIEEAFGTLVQKDGWRSCLNRQLFHGVVRLKGAIRLGEPLTPEIVVDDETIYVRPPSAIHPGLAGRVLKELPEIPSGHLELLKGCLKKLYPSETALLEDAMDKINNAVATSKKR
jgi:DNA-binding Lrp family transcriptional regulator